MQPPATSSSDERFALLLAGGQGHLPWNDWAAWCEVADRPALGAGPADVAAWLVDVALVGLLEANEVDAVLDAIADRHESAGLSDPTQGGRILAA